MVLGGVLLAWGAPVSAQQCTGDEHIEADCKEKRGEQTRARIRLTRAARETEVEFVITNVDREDVVIRATTTRRGKAVVKTRDLVPGDHEVTVFIVEGRQECERDEFDCD